MEKKSAPIVPALWGAAILLLTVQVAASALLRYFADGDPPPPPIIANAFSDPFLAVHVAAGVTALVVGPLQFLASIRKRAPMLHRAIGMTYVGACAISLPASLMLAVGTTSGPVAGAGFAILGLLLAVFTWLGLRAAIERRFADHRRWMLRSYAMTATAITLRLMIPAAGFLGLDFLPAYQAIAWLSWMTNLALVEFYIRRNRGLAVGRPALAAA